MMLTINRAGYKFGWFEMMSMPISRLKRYNYISQEFFKAQEAELKRKQK